MKSYVMKIQQHTHSDAAKLILYQNKAYEVIVQGEIYLSLIHIYLLFDK